MRSRLSVAKVRYFLLLAVIAACGSCSSIPVGKYQALQEASQSVLNNTSETYKRVEKLQRLFSVVTAPNQALARDSFKPQIDGQSYDLVPELRFREAALEVLVKYTVILHSFSAKDYVSEVDKASQQLAGSLKNLIETSKGMKVEEAKIASGILGTVVDVIGRAMVQFTRWRALKTVMDSTEDDVKRLAALIVGSNVKIKNTVDIMVNRVVAHAKANRPPYGGWERVVYDQKIAAVVAEAEEIQGAIDSVNVAITKIPEAHSEIRAVLEEKPITLGALQALIQEAERANKFYRNLTP